MTNGNPGRKSENESANPHFAVAIAALVITGLGIGWLAGLSVSPVISVVITSVIGVAAAVVTALSGLKQAPTNAEPTKEQQPLRIEVWPLAVLVFAVVIGSWLGILARNNHLFGSDVSSEIKKWAKVGVPEEAVLERLFGSTTTYSPYTAPYTETLQLEIDRWTSLGIPEEQVVNRLFEQHFSNDRPATQTVTSPLATDERTGTLLLAAAAQEECDAWQKLIDKESYDELARQVSTSEVLPFRQLPTIITDTMKLAAVVEEVLCAETQP